MTGGFPIFGSASLNETSGHINLGSGVLSANNTKSSWVQAISSTARNTSLVLAQIISGGTIYSGSLDIGVGSLGNEIVLVPDLYFGPGSGAGQSTWSTYSYSCPILIPAGTRVAVRAQVSGNFGSSDFKVNLICYDGGFQSSQVGVIDALGFSPATTTGTSLQGAGGGGTGSFVQLISPTARDYLGFFAAIGANSGSLDEISSIDIAVGGIGNESSIYRGGTARINGISFTVPALVPVQIPAGSRISARIVTAVGANTIDIVLYGVA